MSYSRVLCLVRGDDSDPAVVDTAVNLTNGHNRNIHFVHVIVVNRRYSLDTSNQTLYTRAEAILREAERTSGFRNETNGSILQARSIGPVLIREALDFGAEVIVLSANIIRSINTKRIDDDSDYLITNAPCAVVLVRERERDFVPNYDHPDIHVEDVVHRRD